MAVVSQQALILQRAEWKRNGKRVVCAVGAFDLLHPGHVRLLEQARGLGDVLVVGVEADDAVREREARTSTSSSGKSANGGNGAGRTLPVNPAAERAEVAAAIGAVDAVALMDEPLEKFLAALAPDIFVHGTEPRQAAAVSAPQGIQVVAIPLEPGFSTGSLLERISTTNA